MKLWRGRAHSASVSPSDRWRALGREGEVLPRKAFCGLLGPCFSSLCKPCSTAQPCALHSLAGRPRYTFYSKWWERLSLGVLSSHNLGRGDLWSAREVGRLVLVEAL